MAVWEGGEATTFAEVNARANRLARHLAGLGVAPGSVVGVALPRSADLLVALLAVLKAGGCYLPMDPAYPAERLAFLRRDGACDAVLATPATATALPEGPGRLLILPPAPGRPVAGRGSRHGRPGRGGSRRPPRPAGEGTPGRPLLRHPHLRFHRRAQGHRAAPPGCRQQSHRPQRALRHRTG
ncbi:MULTISPECIES: AMP-binding protein [unclassified Streptomyces]|uniref:AMP-binding protein n=1 Tax=unclassified Streptomyces TaxID=2593676 RepID=UPI004041F4A5